MITFDDINKSQMSIAYPYLKKRDLTAMCFVPTDFIGKKGRLSWRDLRTLQKNGWEIASHTKSHVDLTMVPIDVAKEEIMGSQRVLREHGFKANAFAYPYGRYNQEIVNIVKTCYDWGRAVQLNDGTRWTIPIGDKMVLFHSIDEPDVISNISLSRFERAINNYLILQCQQ